MVLPKLPHFQNNFSWDRIAIDETVRIYFFLKKYDHVLLKCGTNVSMELDFYFQAFLGTEDEINLTLKDQITREVCRTTKTIARRCFFKSFCQGNNRKRQLSKEATIQMHLSKKGTFSTS